MDRDKELRHMCTKCYQRKATGRLCDKCYAILDKAMKKENAMIK